MNLDEDKVIRSGNRLGWIILTIITIIVIIFTSIIIGIYKLFTNPIPRKFYILDVNDNNKQEVIGLFEKETKNDKYIKKHCDSIYKIEYNVLFPDGTSYTMYCSDEDDIHFGIDKSGVDTLAEYIRENGYTEKR